MPGGCTHPGQGITSCLGLQAIQGAVGERAGHVDQVGCRAGHVALGAFEVFGGFGCGGGGAAQ